MKKLLLIYFEYSAAAHSAILHFYVTQLGLVCFRLKNDPSNKLNKKLLESINDSGKLHMVPAMVHDKFVIRFCVVTQNATEADMGK